MNHSCLLCDPEDGDGTDSEVCGEWHGEGYEDEDPLRRFECLYPGRCLCPHVEHQGWECFTAEDVEDAAG